MDLNQEFTVGLPIAQTWTLLTDVARIAPCLPGARLTGSDGNTHNGEVKIKVGPITAHYQGTVVFAEMDEPNHHFALAAHGKEKRGSGTAQAQVNVRLEALAAGTRVVIHTDLGLSGRVAQFGRGIIADVSSKLLNQFAANLEALAGDDPGANPATPNTAEQPDAGARAVDTLPADDFALDLGTLIGSGLFRRISPIVVAAGVSAFVTWFISHRRKPDDHHCGNFDARRMPVYWGQMDSGPRP